MSHNIRFGTRSSRMALLMAEKAKSLLEGAYKGCSVEILQFKSFGDKFMGDLKAHGGKGAFVNDLEQRLLNHEIDCAVHCVKDIPGDCTPNPNLKLYSFLPREDVYDSLIMKPGRDKPKFFEESTDLIFGTSSPRRACILKKLYPGCKIKPLRGNAETRLRKLEEEDYDGIVLSYAGLKYLGMTEVVSYIYDPEEMLPAVGQGALVLQVRTEDAEKCTFLREINSEETEKSILEERSMLYALNGNCHSAIAGYFRKEGLKYRLDGLVGSEATGAFIKEKTILDSSYQGNAGALLANKLIEKGAKDFINAQQ